MLSEAQAALEVRAGDAAVRSAARAALEAARGCYAPYTHSASGAAVVTGSGAVFRLRAPEVHFSCGSRCLRQHERNLMLSAVVWQNIYLLLCSAQTLLNAP